MHLLTLDYSLKLAALGIPCCVLAIALAAAGATGSAAFNGLIISSALNLAMWLFLITFH